MPAVISSTCDIACETVLFVVFALNDSTITMYRHSARVSVILHAVTLTVMYCICALFFRFNGFSRTLACITAKHVRRQFVYSAGAVNFLCLNVKLC